MIEKMVLITHRLVLSVALVALLSACASLGPRESCPVGTQDLPDCPPMSAVDDPAINELYELRTWVPARKLDIDPIELGKQAKIPIQSARVKFLGPRPEDALNSLAAKIWMIEHAEHTVDAIYYIFSYDLIGYSMLGPATG